MSTEISEAGALKCLGHETKLLLEESSNLASVWSKNVIAMAAHAFDVGAPASGRNPVNPHYPEYRFRA